MAWECCNASLHIVFYGTLPTVIYIDIDEPKRHLMLPSHLKFAQGFVKHPNNAYTVRDSKSFTNNQWDSKVKNDR